MSRLPRLSPAQARLVEKLREGFIVGRSGWIYPDSVEGGLGKPFALESTVRNLYYRRGMLDQHIKRTGASSFIHYRLKPEFQGEK